MLLFLLVVVLALLQKLHPLPLDDTGGSGGGRQMVLIILVVSGILEHGQVVFWYQLLVILVDSAGYGGGGSVGGKMDDDQFNSWTLILYSITNSNSSFAIKLDTGLLVVELQL